MSTPSQQTGLMRLFVLPALWVFLIPVATLAFFWHGTSLMDREWAAAVVQSLRQERDFDPKELPEVERRLAEFPASKLILLPENADLFSSMSHWTYWQFRWLIRLAIASLALSVVSFVVLGGALLVSNRSPTGLFYTLYFGWLSLQWISVFQVIALGLMVLGLSFWVTALWFNIYVPKLILIAAILVLVAVGAVVMAIFKRIPTDASVQGFELAEENAAGLWDRVRQLCGRLGTAPPNHIIAGIDSNFFVTEQPLRLEDGELRGRLLFVSLPLLRLLNGTEADAVLAHEMAHFQGQDTMYSRRTMPLIGKFNHYLEILYDSPVSKPVFYFMNCFRAMFEMAMGKFSREREFRADRLAAELTSSSDLTHALWRIAAYSHYRDQVEQELFNQEQVLEQANICDRIEQGFADFVSQVSNVSHLGDWHTTHPFDTHPSMNDRMNSLGYPFDESRLCPVLTNWGDGKWYHEITRCDELERAMWDEYEDGFRKAHEQMLAFRFLPENAEERAVVEKEFPPVTIESSEGLLELDCLAVKHAPWEAPIQFSEVSSCESSDHALTIHFKRDGKSQVKNLKYAKFGKKREELLQHFQNYYSRYVFATEYKKAQQNQDANG